MTENILLSANDFGLGAYWLYVYNPDTPEVERQVKKILDLFSNIIVPCFVAIGYSEKNLLSQKLRNLSEIIYIERW